MKQFISYLLGCSFLITSPAFSLILLDQEMSPEQQKKSGISKLTEAEQRHLEEWLDDHFVKKSESEKKIFGEKLYVSEIINGGQRLRLSNNSLYELAPEDWIHAQAWITSAEVQVTHSPNEYYPFTITNPSSGYSVKARLIGSGISEDDATLHREEVIEKAIKEYGKTQEKSGTP